MQLHLVVCILPMAAFALLSNCTTNANVLSWLCTASQSTTNFNDTAKI